MLSAQTAHPGTRVRDRTCVPTGQHNPPPNRPLRLRPWKPGHLAVCPTTSLPIQRVGMWAGITHATKQQAELANALPRSSNKPVAPMPAQDKELVQMLILLSGLANRLDSVMAPTLAAQTGLSLVTTSATCAASPLSSMSDDFGDGMALPLCDVRRASEQLARSLGTQGLQAAWSPPQRSAPPRPAALAGRAGAAAEGRRSTLDALFAANDHRSLQAGGSGSGTAAGDDGLLLSQLRRQVGRAAAKAVAAGKPLASSLGEATTKAASVTSKAASATVAAVVKNVQLSAQQGVAPQAAAAYAAAAAFADDSGSVSSGSDTPTSSRGGAAAAALSRAASAAAAKGAALADPFFQATPASSWLIADDAAARVRYIAIAAPESLARVAKQPTSDLVTFESFTLGAKINRQLYDEAQALYQRFIPLVLDYLEDEPAGRVCLVGQGLGGSLATVVALMAAHRGLAHGALAPVHAFNAPPVLAEVRDAKVWCSREGCSTEEMGAMVEDLLRRGVLSELGLPQDAVRNVYYTATAAQAASAGSTGNVGAKGGLGSWDVGALLQSALVPEVLKSWLRGFSASGTGSKGGSKGGSKVSKGGAGAQARVSATQPLMMLNPVGRLLLYTADPSTNGVH